MKFFSASILAPIALSAFEAFIMLAMIGPSFEEKHPVLINLFIGAWGWTCLGGFWMLIIAVLKDKKPAPMVALALLVPNSFLWYYFARVLPRRRAEREAGELGWM
jgi:hypothetical protein